MVVVVVVAVMMPRGACLLSTGVRAGGFGWVSRGVWWSGGELVCVVGCAVRALGQRGGGCGYNSRRGLWSRRSGGLVVGRAVAGCSQQQAVDEAC